MSLVFEFILPSSPVFIQPFESLTVRHNIYIKCQNIAMTYRHGCGKRCAFRVVVLLLGARTTDSSHVTQRCGRLLWVILIFIGAPLMALPNCVVTLR